MFKKLQENQLNYLNDLTRIYNEYYIEITPNKLYNRILNKISKEYKKNTEDKTRLDYNIRNIFHTYCVDNEEFKQFIIEEAKNKNWREKIKTEKKFSNALIDNMGREILSEKLAKEYVEDKYRYLNDKNSYGVYAKILKNKINLYVRSQPRRYYACPVKTLKNFTKTPTRIKFNSIIEFYKDEL